MVLAGVSRCAAMQVVSNPLLRNTITAVNKASLQSKLQQQFKMATNNISTHHQYSIDNNTAVSVACYSSSSQSAAAPPPPPPPPPPPTNSAFDTPTSVDHAIAKGVQSTTLIYIRHGSGRRRLDNLAHQSKLEKEQKQPQRPHDGSTSTLVLRWQKMMQTFLEKQVHAIAGLGYPASEEGIRLYNQQLAELMQSSSPDIQEELRIQGRDMWREVLCLAFGLDLKTDLVKQTDNGDELSIVKARNIMHKVSQKMQEPAILEKVAHLVASVPAATAGNEDVTRKHTIVQEVLVHDVYLGKSDSSQMSLVEECGFAFGEKGYVQMQCLMAEHQMDPLVTQYMGGAMVKLLQAAGIDLAGLQQQK